MPLEKKIIKRFTAGEASAFDIIYHHYSTKLYHFGLGLLKDPDAASEMVQEVFVTLWEKRTLVNPELNFENYLFTIAQNTIRKYFRMKVVEKKVKDYLFNNSHEPVWKLEDSLICDEIYALVLRSVGKMPDKRRIVYKMSREEGMCVKEIAGKLGISKRTVENHLYDAIKYLRSEMVKLSLL